MSYEHRGMVIPDDMLDALMTYVEHGVEPGGFLSAVISNDLREAAARADHRNAPILAAYVAWLYNEAPSTCWGSHAKMDAWMQRHAEDREDAARFAEQQNRQDDRDAAADAKFDMRKDEGEL